MTTNITWSKAMDYSQFGVPDIIGDPNSRRNNRFLERVVRAASHAALGAWVVRNGTGEQGPAFNPDGY